MSSYFQRILRGAQSQWPVGNPYRDTVDWNAVMASLMTTGTALAGGNTLTLSGGNVTTAVFNPVALGGGSSLAGWFKADALSLANNDPVSTWTDASGQTNNATQTLTARPAFKTNVQNGRPGVLFAAASSQFMAADGLSAVQNGTDLPFTVILAIKPISLTPASIQSFCAWGNSASANARVLLVSDTNLYRLYRRDDAAAQVISSGAAAYTTNAQIVTFVYSGTSISIYLNGTVTLNAGASDNGALTINRFALGSRIDAGVASLFYDGYQLETLIYSAALSNADRQAAERSLGSKWSITVA